MTEEKATKVIKKPKVVFTFVEAGMAHIISASGMHDAFKKKYGDKCEVIKSYVFSDSKNPVVNKMGEEQSAHTKRLAANKLYSKFEAISYQFPSTFVLGILDIHFREGINAFQSELQELAPDLIVSTYYLPSHIARLANEKQKTDTLIATYSPDPYIYPAWDRKCDVFFVTNDAAKKDALKKGFKEKQVKQIPFVYKKELLELNKTKEEARKSLGIQDGFTVLYTSGAYGTKNAEKFIDGILNSGLKINLVAVCGKNEELLQKFNALAKNNTDSVTFYPLGFTDRLAEYMLASDIIVGKAGGVTLMEAANLKRFYIMCAEANRLEEKIAEFFEEKGVAVKIHAPEKIVDFIKECAKNDDYIKEREENFEQFQDKTGAEKAADEMFELLKRKFPELN